MSILLAGAENLTLTGRLRHDDAALTCAAVDFGGVAKRHPMAVLVPANATDIAQVVRFAADRGIPVSARGSAHSLYGQSLVSQGIVIDMKGLGTVHRVDGDQALVDAGASWRAVLAATLPHGLTPPVLPDFLDLSVGGTLSLGGIGGTSHRHGAQVDTVIELEVVTGTGEIVTCSRTSNVALFRAVLAGLGQCAIITRATIPLIAAPTHVQHTRTRYETTAELNAAQVARVDEGRTDYVEGLVTQDGEGGWLRWMETVAYLGEGHALGESTIQDNGVVMESTTKSYFDFVNRLGDEAAFLADLGPQSQVRPYCTVFVPSGAVDAAVDAALARPLSEVGEQGLYLVYPLRRSRLSTPLFRLPDDEVVFQFSVFRYAGSEATEVVEGMLAANRVMHAEALRCGGTLYPYSAVELDPQGWRDHWGEEWSFLEEAKASHDPQGVLGCGQGIFRTR
ncbi:FAD-binding protein [Kutzneria sp. NPDC052558]|uniref:FAD-binding protein n=1 Tax=Kutzneria sp. NPDC052558 TaxID=3364121 RepID=UPI0037CBF847